MATKRSKSSKNRTSPKTSTRTAATSVTLPVSGGPRCGLCGKIANLTRTACCDRWICNDEQEYQLFSFAHNSCSRNHRRYTLCGGHFDNEHEGRWQDCAECRENFETEMYVYFGTNEYNFEKLPDPPSYEPTRCVHCQKVIRLGYDGFSRNRDGYFCERCSAAALRARR